LLRWSCRRFTRGPCRRTGSQIKQLEAQKKLIEKRDTDVPKALETLAKYAEVLTGVQRRKVARLIGETLEAPAASPVPGKKEAAKKGVAKGAKLGPVAPKYQIPFGET
jgi:DNA-binding protein H-NS